MPRGRQLKRRATRRRVQHSHDREVFAVLEQTQGRGIDFDAEKEIKMHAEEVRHHCAYNIPVRDDDDEAMLAAQLIQFANRAHLDLQHELAAGELRAAAERVERSPKRQLRKLSERAVFPL